MLQRYKQHPWNKSNLLLTLSASFILIIFGLVIGIIIICTNYTIQSKIETLSCYIEDRHLKFSGDYSVITVTFNVTTSLSDEVKYIDMDFYSTTDLSRAMLDYVIDSNVACYDDKNMLSFYTLNSLYEAFGVMALCMIIIGILILLIPMYAPFTKSLLT